MLRSRSHHRRRDSPFAPIMRLAVISGAAAFVVGGMGFISLSDKTDTSPIVAGPVVAGSAPSSAAVRPDTGRDPAYATGQLWTSYPSQAAQDPTGSPMNATLAVNTLTPEQSRADGDIPGPRFAGPSPAPAAGRSGPAAAPAVGRSAAPPSPAPAMGGSADTASTASSPKPTPAPAGGSSSRQNSCPSLLGLLRLCVNLSLG